MKKLRLDVDALHVDSFDVNALGGASGTVQANSASEAGASCGYGTACWPYCGNNTDGDCTHTYDGGSECWKPSMYNNDCTM